MAAQHKRSNPRHPTSIRRDRTPPADRRSRRPAVKAPPSSDSNRDTGRDYEVGYGKPPKNTRFKPGQSGNPRGRPKGSKNFATDLAEVLLEHVNVNEGGRKRRVTKQRATIMATINRAMKGEPAAVARFLQMHQAYPTGRSEDVEPALTDDEAALLEAFVAEKIEKSRKEQDDENE